MGSNVYKCEFYAIRQNIEGIGWRRMPSSDLETINIYAKDVEQAMQKIRQNFEVTSFINISKVCYVAF